ncbi:MAG TPA: carbamoyl-phosphate synthase large subunit, partial [Micromonosporaceae bacterium]
GIAVLREVGVDTGGCNIQFAVHPGTGRLVVIEMNPRVSRSSALASKATGFPIAKIAAKLAVGYTLDEIDNDITRATPASFEPTLDYVVVKVPRFAFEKFGGADPRLTTTMKSVGEAMALGRDFTEALGKALRSMERVSGEFSFANPPGDTAALVEHCRTAHDGRLKTVQRALWAGATVERLHEATGIDPWFLDQIALVNEVAADLAGRDLDSLDGVALRWAKRTGLSDRQLAELLGADEVAVRARRHALGIRPVYKTVDTCAAEFAARTPYHYSSYDEETEVAGSDRPKVVILGSGPNRIGQGIEFDYSCVHAVMALRSAPDPRGGYETVMVNCNPETVSTDYDTSDRLYFEPLTFEDVLEVIHAEDSSGRLAGGPGVVGVIVQLGGQTPLGLARGLADAGVPIVGTPPQAIHLAEERGAFGALLAEAGLPAPAHGTASSYPEAKRIADEIGYPVLVRPSYVLGGRGMEIVYDDAMLEAYITRATQISPEHPVLVDRFLDDAIEIDVDALCDATGAVYLGGIMEHIEEAGIHSGDSACALPPITLTERNVTQVRAYTEKLANGIGVRGLLNVQYALKDEDLYVLEANPRASRTVPFVSKATAVPLAKAAARIMLGATIAELRTEGMLPPLGDGGDLPDEAPIAVKEAVLPFKRFHTREGRGIDSLLGPEMKSTGEVMGIDFAFGHAYAKSQAAVYGSLPSSGKVLVTLADRDKRAMIFPVKRLADLGFQVLATSGTAHLLRRHGIVCRTVPKHFDSTGDGERHTVELIEAGEIDLVINTPHGSTGPRVDGYEIRSAAVATDTPCITTVPGAAAAVMGIEALIRGDLRVRPLQRLHAWARRDG